MGPLYGIDGYIRPSTSAALQGDERRSNWINLCVNDQVRCAQWVQVGTYQGQNPQGPSTYSAVHIFVERNWAGCFYNFVDKGTLANANQAYYLTSTGGTTSGCGLTQHEYAFRKISVTSSPIYYGYMKASSGWAVSKTELQVIDRSVPQGTEYFGTDDTHSASGGYGLHVQTSLGGTWQLWSSSQIGAVIHDDPPSVTPLSTPWAFSTGP